MSLYDKIPDVMDRFDFDEVHKVMTFLDWNWANTQLGRAVPTIDELKSCALMCLSHAVADWEKRGKPANGSSCATGGFEAIVNVYDSHTQVSLRFYVDHTSSL